MFHKEWPGEVAHALNLPSMLLQSTLNWVHYKQQKFISQSSRVCEGQEPDASRCYVVRTLSLLLVWQNR